MRLDEIGFLRVAQYFQHIVVGNEVETGKYVPFGFQIFLQSSLYQLEFVVHFVEVLEQFRRLDEMRRAHCCLTAVHLVTQIPPGRRQMIEIFRFFRQLLADILAEEYILEKIILEGSRDPDLNQRLQIH